jgi:hypothetical protein
MTCRRRNILTGVAAVVGVVIVVTWFQSTSFDRRVERLQVGMSIKQVRDLLGEPDFSEANVELFLRPRVKLMWLVYQQSGRLAGPRPLGRTIASEFTSGTVRVDFIDGRVSSIFRPGEVAPLKVPALPE